MRLFSNKDYIISEIYFKTPFLFTLEVAFRIVRQPKWTVTFKYFYLAMLHVTCVIKVECFFN